VKEFILEKGYDSKFGARPLRRTIQKYIEDELSEMYLKGLIKQGSIIASKVIDGSISLEVLASN
jgi:ATP-dependent Clp protease ATP-binding subunit ClpE